MEDIEYLDEYKDLVMPGINKNVSRTSAVAAAASASGSGQRRRRLSSESTNSSSIDADIFQKLFHGKFSDDELPSKSSSKARGRRPPLSPSSSDESNDALEALFNRKTNLGSQVHKRRERYESLDSIDDLSQALMRPTHKSTASKPKKSYPLKSSNSSTSNNNKSNVSAKSTSSQSTKSSTGQQNKHERSSDMPRLGGPTNGNSSGRNKAVTIVKPIKPSLTPNKSDPKTDPLNLKDYLDGTDSDSSYEYESDFYGVEDDDDISNPIIDLSTDTSRTNSVAETVTPVVSEDDDSADPAGKQEQQDQTSVKEPPQSQQPTMCGDNELLQYYLNNLSKAETPPIYKKLTSGRKCRSGEKKSPSSSVEQVKHTATEPCEPVVVKEATTGSEEKKEITETATDPSSAENPKEKPFDLNDSLTLESVQLISLDLAEQIMQIDNERTIEYERHSGSKGRSIRSRSNMSDDHSRTSHSKSSSALVNHHVRKLTYSNDQLDKCVPSQTNELRRTKSDSAFPKRNSRGRFTKSIEKSKGPTEVRAKSNSAQETPAVASVPTEMPIKRKRGRPRKVKKPTKTKPDNNTKTGLELVKENRRIPDKAINETPTTEPLSSLETQALIETENKDGTITEKIANANESRLNDKDVGADVRATTAPEIHQSHDEKTIEDSTLHPETKDVPRDLKPTAIEAQEATLPAKSVRRRALRSNDRKSELSSQEDEPTPLKAHESRSSRRMPKSETPTLSDDQMKPMRNRKRNDSLKLASQQPAPSTPDIEREKSPIDKQPRVTHKRSKDKLEMASPSPALGERITRSTKREEPEEKREQTRSSERSSRRETTTRSSKEIETESTDSSAIANEVKLNTENQICHESNTSKKKTKKTFEPKPHAIAELDKEKVFIDGEKSAALLELTTSDEIKKIVKDLDSDFVQPVGDLATNLIKTNSHNEIEKDENGKGIQDKKKIEPVKESTENDLKKDNINDKSNRELNTEPAPSKLYTEGVDEKNVENFTIEKKKNKQQNKNPLKQVRRVPQPVEKKAKIRSGKKKTLDSKQNDNEPESSVNIITLGESESSQETNTEKTELELEEDKFVFVEEPVQMQEKPNLENTEECNDKNINFVPLDATPQAGMDVEVMNSIENNKLNLIQSPVDISQELGTESTLKTSDHEQILSKETELDQAEPLMEESTENNQINSKEDNERKVATDAVKHVEVEGVKHDGIENNLSDSKPDSEPKTMDGPDIAEQSTDIKEVEETPRASESEPTEKTACEDTNPVVSPGEPNNGKAEDNQTLSIETNQDKKPMSSSNETDESTTKVVSPGEPNNGKAEDNQTLSIETDQDKKPMSSSNETDESTTKKISLTLKTPRSTKMKIFKKRRATFGKKKKKFRSNNVNVAVEQPTEAIAESLEVSQPPHSPEMEICKSSTSGSSTTTTVSPTSGSCRKLRVLVKRTPTTGECLGTDWRSLIMRKKSSRFADKLDCIAELPVTSSAMENTEISNKHDPKPTECTNAEEPTPTINQDLLDNISTGLAHIDAAHAHTENSPTDCGLETTGVTLDEESSQLDEAAKQKKLEQRKSDMESVVIKKQGRRRKQMNEMDQPDKKRSKLNLVANTPEKGNPISIANKKPLGPTESTKKILVQAVLGPNVSLRKPEDVNSSEDQSYVTVLTKKSTESVSTTQENKTVQPAVGAAPRKVNISVSVLPAKEVEPELPATPEKNNITASIVGGKKNKFIPKKTTQLAPKKTTVLGTSKSPEKKLLTQTEQSNKSEIKTGSAVTVTPPAKTLPKAKHGPEVDKIVVAPPVHQVAEPQQQMESEVPAKKSLQQDLRRKKLTSRKSEGAKTSKSANKADPLANTTGRKSLPLAKSSQKLAKLKANEIAVGMETTESLDQSVSSDKLKSEDKKRSSNGLVTETASSSMLGKKLRKTVTSVAATHMTRSSSCNRSLSSTPISSAAAKGQRNVLNKASVGEKVEARKVNLNPRMNLRRLQKDQETPLLELVSHGYTRKRKMAASVAVNAKRPKQQAEPQQQPKEKDSSPSHKEHVVTGDHHAGAEKIPQSQIQQEISQLEQVEQDETHLEAIQQEKAQSLKSDHQKKAQQKGVQQKDMQQRENVPPLPDVAFPVMITAALNQPPSLSAPMSSTVPVANSSETLVKEVEVRTIRQCRVRLNRNIARKWLGEQREMLQQKENHKKRIESGTEERQTAINLAEVLPPTVQTDDQLPAVETSPQSHPIRSDQSLLLPVPVPNPVPVPTAATEEVKSEAEEVPVLVPASLHLPAAPTSALHPTQQSIRFNAPIPSASNQNSATTTAAAGQLPFGSTKMFSFLYPMRYQQSYGAVGLDFCCPNLDGPMRAIDPTRLHDKVELPVLELPQYMVISTKFISKQDKNIPSKVRAKMAEMAKNGKPLAGQTIQIGMLTPDPPQQISPETNELSVPALVLPAPASVPPVPGPSLLSVAPGSMREPEVSSIDALTRQLPRGTTLTKKILPPGVSLPLPTVSSGSSGSSTASQLVPPGLIQMPPICPKDKQRVELQTRVQLFDLVLQDLSRRATLMTVAERQKTIEEIVKTSTLLPIDVDVGTKLLENYVYYLNRATNSNIPVPTYRINAVVAPTTSAAIASPQPPASNSVLSKGPSVIRNPQLRNCLSASIPLYDGDRNIIGYQRPLQSATTTSLTAAASPSSTVVAQNQRLGTRPADKPASTFVNRKAVVKAIPPQTAWTPEKGGPTIRSIKDVGTGTMISFNSPTVQKPPTVLKPRPITKSPAIGKVSEPTSSNPTTSPALNSVSAAPNITPNVFIVNQVPAQPEECILPDVTNTVPLEAHIKGEVEDVVEIAP